MFIQGATSIPDSRVDEKNVEDEKFPKTIRFAAMGCRKGISYPISMRIKPGLFFHLNQDFILACQLQCSSHILLCTLFQGVIISKI